MTRTPPPACLSVDLDNEWSYLKTHGDPAWRTYPSYIPRVVPRILAVLEDLGLKATFFLVGHDAASPANRETLRSIAAAGHEVGNHSQSHEPWLHRYTAEQLDQEIGQAEAAIEAATGVRPVGFRGPGYSISRTALEVLAGRGYRYDASTLPTFLGPLARAYYFMRSPLDKGQRAERARLFGSIRDGLRPIRPYLCKLQASTLLEIPVTTFPVFRIPFHFSYMLYLSTRLPGLARLYWRMALRACRLARLGPSMLLHPLDFLGCDEVATLSFFPGMNLKSEVKVERVAACLEGFRDSFAVMPLRDYAARLEGNGSLSLRRPDFPEA